MRLALRARHYVETVKDLVRQLTERDVEVSREMTKLGAAVSAGTAASYIVSGTGGDTTQATLTEDTAAGGVRLSGGKVRVGTRGWYLVSHHAHATGDSASNPLALGSIVRLNGDSLTRGLARRFSATTNLSVSWACSILVFLETTDELDIEIDVGAGNLTFVSTRGRSMLTISLHTPAIQEGA